MTSLRSPIYCLFALIFAATALVSAQTASDVTTWHNDINRTGWQSNESTLTPSSPPFDCQGAKVSSAALHTFNATNNGSAMADLYTSRGLNTLGSASAFLSPTIFQSRIFENRDQTATHGRGLFGLRRRAIRMTSSSLRSP